MTKVRFVLTKGKRHLVILAEGDPLDDVSLVFEGDEEAAQQIRQDLQDFGEHSDILDATSRIEAFSRFNNWKLVGEQTAGLPLSEYVLDLIHH